MTRPDSRKTAFAVATWMVLLPKLPGVGADMIESSGELLNDKDCTATDGGPLSGEAGETKDSDSSLYQETEQTALYSSDWLVERMPDGAKSAYKKLVIGFESRGKQSVQSLAPDADADPQIEIKNCSSGVCTVTLHVHEKTVTSVKMHGGLFAFLPWAYAKVFVEQEVQVETESEIQCAGEAFVVLTGSGGVGPRSVSASIWKDDVSQMFEYCSYLNVPEDHECQIVFAKDFEIEARTPGEYTRFDVVHGGRLRNDLAVSAAIGLSSLAETPEVEIETSPGQGFHQGPIQVGSAGEWRTVFAGIEIDVDAEEATAAFMDLLE